MKTKLTLTLAALVLFTTFAWADDAATGDALTSRSFKLNYRSPERAAAVIRQLVSTEGSISLQPAANTIVVTDRPENLRAIANAIERFDAPPKGFRIELKVVAASRAASPGAVAEDLKEVAGKLGAVLRFNAFEKVGEFAAEGKEGDPLANIQVGQTYRADLKFGEYDPVSDSIRLEDFRLSRTQATPDGTSEVAPLLKRTALNVKIGQTLILGAARTPGEERALMLVIVARPAAQ